MGGTVPLLTQGLAKSLADATRFHALVYGCNTAGAFGGALAAGFVLLPALGLTGAMLATGLVNVAVGVIFLALGRTRAPSDATPLEPEPARASGLGPFVAIALLCGFAAMAIQAVWNRMAALALGSSPYTFTLVVALFVACIALGSLAVSLLPRVSARWLSWNLLLLLLAFAGLHAVLDRAPFAAHELRLEFGADDVSFVGYWRSVLGKMLLLAGPAVALSGATLPLLFHAARGSHADLGGVAGRLYAWNTVGSLAGALVGGHLLLVWLDLADVHRIALARARARLRARAVARSKAPAARRARRRRVARARASRSRAGTRARSRSGLFRVRERLSAPALHGGRRARRPLPRPHAALLRRRSGRIGRGAGDHARRRKAPRRLHEREAGRRDPGRLPDHGARRAAPRRAPAAAWSAPS